MRLICPNCGAQYEVPDDVIPATGRDVQCSNCGDTWFQKHPSQDREMAEELGQTLDEAHWDETEEAAQEPAPEPQAEPEAEPEPEAGPEIEEPAAERADAGEDTPGDAYTDDADMSDAEPGDADSGDADTGDDGWGEDEYEEEDAEEAPAATPRELDPEVREILRAEAEQEMHARQSEASTLETQPDLGLDEAGDEASQREREAKQRMARMRGEPDDDTAAGAAAAGLAANSSRRDLLPDIDEINSTLRKSSERGEMAEEYDAPEVAQRKGFSKGFLTILVLFVLAVLLYVFAGQLSEAVPALSGALEAYVAAVDGLRAWLNDRILDLLGWLDGLTGGDTGGETGTTTTGSESGS